MYHVYGRCLHSANPLDDELLAAVSRGMPVVLALLQQRAVADRQAQATLLRPVGHVLGRSTRFVLSTDANPPPEPVLAARRAAQGPLTFEGPLGCCAVAPQQVFVPVHPDAVLVVGAWEEPTGDAIQAGEGGGTPRGVGPPLCVLRVDTMTWLAVV